MVCPISDAGRRNGWPIGLPRHGEIDSHRTLRQLPTRGRSRPPRSSLPVLGLSVVEEAGFGEHDPGPDCDGLAFSKFLDRYGMPDWESDPHAVTFPGGETVAEFHHRVGGTLSRVVRDHRGGAIVVACHGGVDRCRVPGVAPVARPRCVRAADHEHVTDRVRQRLAAIAGGWCATTTPPTSPASRPSRRGRRRSWPVVAPGGW